MARHFTTGSTIIDAAIIGAIICVLIYHLTRVRLYKEASKFHGPPGLPFLGNALEFLGNNEDILSKWMGLANEYSSPLRIWLGPKLLIVVHDPEQIKKVLCSDTTIEKSDLYRFFRPWVGHGLFSASAAIWRVHRKLIGPTFNLKILESFVEIFAAQSHTMVQKLESKLNGGEFEIFDSLTLCTLDIICETAMGVSMEAQIKNNRAYSHTAEKLLGIIYKRAFKAWIHPDLIFNRTQLGREQKEYIETMHRFSNDVIRKKKKSLLNQNNEKSKINRESDSDDLTLKKGPQFQRKAYLDLLMELTHGEMKFTETELREEVDTMMVAGNDTTATVMSYAMLMLASYQDVQEKVYRELYEIYGSYDIDERNVTPEDLPRMEYMERVIKETMRLFPIAATIVRSVTEDLNIGEHTLPKGSEVLVHIFAVQRNEEYWDDPLIFNPDRFLPEETAKRHSYCYLPFSAGPRNCIGARFAMMEMKTIIATILRRYRLKKDNPLPISDIRLKADSITKPVDPITLRIERRTLNVE